MKFYKNSGITLIALVVTIVVLLILAGISISMLTGQNGILNRASEAKEKTEQAKQDEEDKMAAMEAMVQTAGTKVTNPSSYGKNSNAQATADGAGKYFALPEGATYVEGTVNTGVVVNIRGSEFVWVPVDDVVWDKNRDNELPKSSDEGTDRGKTYTPMAMKVGDDYKGLLYEFSGSNGYLMYGSNSSTNYQGSDTDYREPDVVSYDSQDSYKLYNITKDGLQAQYNSMIASVLKYKGFYVARYEAGIQNSKVVFKNADKTEGVTTLDASENSANMWYGLYEKMASFAETNDKFVSSMIWGSQYDAMMNWMVKTEKTVGTADSTGTKRNTDTVTGKNTNDVINNVYDLYGCHYEWTLENCNTSYRASRGGYYLNSLSPANRYNYNPNEIYFDYSSRAALMIK
mgnify:CR=1 FL=1